MDRKRILDILCSFYDNVDEPMRNSLRNPRKCKFIVIMLLTVCGILEFLGSMLFKYQRLIKISYNHGVFNNFDPCSYPTLEGWMMILSGLLIMYLQ